jgi:hypothetical protein
LADLLVTLGERQAAPGKNDRAAPDGRAARD